MAAHKVSGGPVNEAIRVLRAEGLVETRQGSGMFVCDPLPEQAASEQEALLNRVDSIADEVRQLTERMESVERALRERPRPPQGGETGP